MVGDRARPGIQAQVSLPENTNYANLLNRRYSHSLPSLQTSGKIWRVYKKYGLTSWDDPDLKYGPGMFSNIEPLGRILDPNQDFSNYLNHLEF